MKLAPMNAYPPPPREGASAKPSTLRTGQLLFHNELIEVHDDEAFFKVWQEIKTIFPERRDFLALLVAGWHDIVNVNIAKVAKDRHVMEVEGIASELRYHHKLESDLPDRELLTRIVSAYDAFKEQFPGFLKIEIQPLLDQYFDKA
jgi:hypothetical protein